ncbi:MAG: helix-turn-helix domain-containing protein [Streptomycetaceae bacterium]|nr:helix-turn-helix domain-containing protein [Streptomycetaceae bacterium]
MTVSAPTATATPHTELGAFLRSRRERITPDQVGLPQTRRRRTPGLRREEVAQLAGVGVTWYTWLEQGRPINVSAQVLFAIGRTLRLNDDEVEHMCRLAGIVPETTRDPIEQVGPEVQRVLDGLATYPASVLNPRYDLLAWNAVYARVFPNLAAPDRPRRNVLWEMFTVPECCNPFPFREQEVLSVVGRLRTAYADHLDDPAWVRLIDALIDASPEFAQAWAAHKVAVSRPHVKFFRHNGVGLLRMVSCVSKLTAYPGQALSVYTPEDEESAERLARLAAGDAPPHSTHAHWTGAERIPSGH